MPRFIELPTHYDLPQVRGEQYDDDGLGCFRGIIFALLFEAIGVVFGFSVWYFAWVVLP